jgi:hypothetical protein
MIDGSAERFRTSGGGAESLPHDLLRQSLGCTVFVQMSCAMAITPEFRGPGTDFQFAIAD